jgi:two-component system cell cycle sensor histidine kinase/response regulator CckA
VALDVAARTSLLDTLPTGVTVHVAGKVVYANPALLRLLGIARLEQAIGQPILDFIHPDYRAITLERAQAVYQGHAPGDPIEVEFLRADGASVAVEVVASRLEWDGQPASQVVVIDISQRKQAERTRQEAEQRYRHLIDALPQGVVVHVDGKIVFANLAAARLAGARSADALLGTSAIDWVHPDSASAASTRIERTYHKLGDQPPLAERLVRPDGSTVDAVISNTMIDWHGRPASQVLVHDITDQLVLERRLQQVQRLESLGLLAGGVAHDFNNLLTGILGHVELARNATPGEGPTVAHLDSIALGARRAADLARQMLCYSGHAAARRGPVDLRTVLEECLRLLRTSFTGNIRLERHLAEELPRVEADGTQLRQVAMNLLTNALDALGTTGGVVRVATGVADLGPEELGRTVAGHELPAGRYAYLEVADTGAGIAERVQARIFDPFFTTKLAGRGLGLAMVLGLVRGHGGAIELTSRVGEGSTFRAYFPAAEGGAHPPVLPPPEAESLSIRPATILVVDDEEAVRNVVEQMLRLDGHRVLTAGDGREALAQLASHREEIDCVLLDLTMPNMDGREAFAALRQIRPGLRVLLSSGYDAQEVLQDFAGQRPDGFVQKPFQIQELLDAVRRVVTRER